jgi:hypothetical protein
MEEIMPYHKQINPSTITRATHGAHSFHSSMNGSIIEKLETVGAALTDDKALNSTQYVVMKHPAGPYIHA